MRQVEYKIKSWERRGHVRTLKSGTKVYVRPTTCNRHDEPGSDGRAREPGDSNHSVAVALDAILAAHDAVATSNVLRVGGYETSFALKNNGGEFLSIDVTLPSYLKGYSNRKFDAAMWGEYDAYAETYAIRVLMRYLCCAIASLRGKPVAAELDVAGNAAETYVRDDADGKSRRHVKIRNVDVCFASNEENAGVSYATVRIKGRNRVVPIWSCPLARRVAKLVRDVAILSSERGEKLNKAVVA